MSESECVALCARLNANTAPGQMFRYYPCVDYRGEWTAFPSGY
jgi:hypothetical protein